MRSILFVLLFAPFTCFAQICTQKKDPATGKLAHIGTTMLTDSAGNEKGVIAFMKVSGQESVMTGWMFKNLNVHKGTGQIQMVVTFSDGSTKRFTGNKRSQVLPSTEGLGVLFAGNLAPADVTWFESHSIVSETFYLYANQTNGFTLTLTPAEAESVMQSVKCIQE
ncbi:MAG: hypothetical protein JSU01_01110 [Bacteroidetes bacterium]|nr:hypothetical protein [Bacteroidota bacterium]